MTGRQTVLEIEGLVKAFGSGPRAVDGLSLRVPKGTVFGCIGLNGAGKTTTIRIVAGLLARDEGTLRLSGRELTPGDPALKREMGFVLDEPLYFDWMSAGEYLRFVGTMYGLDAPVARRRAEELIEFFDLSAKGQDPIETFSTGMKKKVSLAAAVIHTPALIMLDEPFEGIDALAGSAIKETLTLMATKGTTVVITSHVLDTVERLCSDIAIVHRGKVVLQCRTDEIRARARRRLRGGTFESLEELFVETVSDKTKRRGLSFL